MRFAEPIYFQKVIPGEYDPVTGDYSKDEVVESKRFASITDSGMQTLKFVYGGIKEGSRTIRIQGHYTESFDRIRIGQKLYHVDFERNLSGIHVFVVSEVQHG